MSDDVKLIKGEIVADARTGDRKRLPVLVSLACADLVVFVLAWIALLGNRTWVLIPVSVSVALALVVVVVGHRMRGSSERSSFAIRSRIVSMAFGYVTLVVSASLLFLAFGAMLFYRAAFG